MKGEADMSGMSEKSKEAYVERFKEMHPTDERRATTAD
jgi:hypothetical protein